MPSALWPGSNSELELETWQRGTYEPLQKLKHVPLETLQLGTTPEALQTQPVSRCDDGTS